MTTQFKFNNGGTVTDFDDVFVRRDSFAVGGLWGLGYNFYGGLGDNTQVIRSSPVQTIAGGVNWKQVSCGTYNTAAIKTDGTLWTWGQNTSGQLGDNTIVIKSSPVQTISGGTNWKQVSLGNSFSSAIKTDGTLWTWGQNNYGQLGDNTVVKKSSPVQTVAGGWTWKQVTCGVNHIAAIKTDGTLWLCGKNDVGQLGDNGSAYSYSSPIQTISGGTNWKQVSCFGNYTAAIKTDGTLWLWGINTNGQLGDGTAVVKKSPVQTIAGGTNWKQVACGYFTAAAIKTDGTLWTWGDNTNGGLGDGTVVQKSSPVQTIAGGTNWKQVSLGNYFTSAIKTDGTLWTWGDNTWGQLGNNTDVKKSSPIQTIAGGTNWKQVSCGPIHSAAITDIF
jgi:alpha-tubulin suppressor-like RCC1 family protein